MSYASVFTSVSSEKRWVHQVNKSVMEQVIIDVPPPPICVFRVPKAIVESKPEAYIPERIGLGPYHHLRAKIQKMMREKLGAVKQVLSRDQILDFQTLVVDKMKELEPSIRACYDEYLDLDGDTLAWILAIDGVYLLCRLGYSLTMNPKFIRMSSSKENVVTNGKLDSQETSSVSMLARDDVGGDSVESKIITQEIEAMESPLSWKDLVNIPPEVAIHPRVLLMLENQIPFFVLKEIQKSLNLNSKGHSLDQMLEAFAEEVSPLQLLHCVKFTDDVCPAHLLDFMYRLVVSNLKPTPKEDQEHSHKRHGERSNAKFEGLKTFLNNMEQFVSMACSDNLPKPFLLLKNLFLLGATAPYDSIIGTSSDQGSKVTVEEINIPSVSELSEVAGVTFSLTPGGIRDIKYDENELVFYLPMITLKSNSEVILRNLIAYEQAFLPEGSILELTEYVELMCGIVDSAKDLEILREKGIINGDMSNDDIANLFNGIPRFHNHPSHRSEVRKACYRVRKRFDSRPMVKGYRFMKKMMLIWWKVLVTLSVVLVVSFVIYKQVCDVYRCNTHIFGRSWEHPLINILLQTDDVAFISSDA